MSSQRQQQGRPQSAAGGPRRGHRHWTAAVYAHHNRRRAPESAHGPGSRVRALATARHPLLTQVGALLAQGAVGWGLLVLRLPGASCYPACQLALISPPTWGGNAVKPMSVSLWKQVCAALTLEVPEPREQHMPSHIYAGTARARGSISATSTAWRSTSASTQWTSWARACQARRPQRRPHLEHAWRRP